MYLYKASIKESDDQIIKANVFLLSDKEINFSDMCVSLIKIKTNVYLIDDNKIIDYRESDNQK